MKIGLYSPYFPKHFGGGEKHFLTSAWYLSQKHQVEVLVPPNVKSLPAQIAKYEALFGLNLSRLTWTRASLAAGKQNPWQTWQFTKQYDAFLYLTDGSLFVSGAKKNILHIQIPFTQTGGRFFNWKLKNWPVKTLTQNLHARWWNRLGTPPFLSALPLHCIPTEKSVPEAKNYSERWSIYGSGPQCHAQ